MLYPTPYPLITPNAGGDSPGYGVVVRSFEEVKYTPELLEFRTVCTRFRGVIDKLSKADIIAYIVCKLSTACEKTIGGLHVEFVPLGRFNGIGCTNILDVAKECKPQGSLFRSFFQAFMKQPLSSYTTRCTILTYGTKDRPITRKQTYEEAEIVSEYMTVYPERDIKLTAQAGTYEILKNTGYPYDYIVYSSNGTIDDGTKPSTMTKTICLRENV